MRRRELITLLGGAAAWPLAVGAQQPERTQCIGVLVPGGADDPVWQARLGAFLQGLRPTSSSPVALQNPEDARPGSK